MKVFCKLIRIDNYINPLLCFPTGKLLIALGVLISIFNLSAMAEINCQSLIEGSPQEKESPQEKYKKGYCYMKLERFNEGLTLLNGLENELPLLADYIVYYRAIGEEGSGNLAGAIENFNKVLNNYPETVLRKRALSGLAEAYYDIGDYRKAEGTFRSAYSGESDSSVKALILNKIGECLEGQGKYIEALSTYKELWVEFPESNFADNAFAKASLISKREGLPFNVSEYDYIRRAERFFKLSRWESALRNFDKVSQKTSDINLKIAISKYHLGFLNEALSVLIRIKTPGSYLWRSKISQRMGRDEEAIETLSQIPLFFPQSELAPEALYTAARLSQINSNFEKAIELYDLLLRKYPKSEFTEDGAWNLGWIYYKRGKYNEALATFSSFNFPQSAYWKARILEKQGKKEEAFAIYKNLSRTAFPSYYSYLAQKKTGVTINLDSFSEPPTREVATERANPRRYKAEFLIELGILEDAVLEIKEMEKTAKDTRDLLDISKLYNKAGDPYNAILVVQKTGHPEAFKLSYPQGFSETVKWLSAKYNVDEFLVYSIMREESRFQKDAVSPAGAIGLMQLIPPTGRSTANKVGISGYDTDMLYLPHINIELGIAYFKEVLEEFNGNVHLALASYNAGPYNVTKWIGKLGSVDADEFVEEIPFRETRNYVRRVLRTYGAYKAIYNNYSPQNRGS